MNSNKYFLWIAAVLLTGAFCAYSAMADIAPPTANYHGLTAVELAPEQTPRLQNGVHHLSRNESRFKERLPLQLRGAMDKIKKAKYRPTSRR